MSAPFLVPLARDAGGAFVGPDEATKGRAYRCPECDATLDLHAGERKRRHFHHRAGASTCSPESVTHLLAKELIAHAVRAWRANETTAPVIIRSCAADGCEAKTRQALPSKVRAAVLEHRVRSGRIVDVALVGAGDLAIAAIEVHHTHAVDDEKSLELPLPWIEVDAAQACTSRGRELVPLRDRFLPWLCAEHASARKRLGAETRRDLNEARALPARRAAAEALLPFDIARYPGFTLGDLVTCPNGHDAIVITWSGREPPFPRPPLVIAVERALDTRFDRVRRGLTSSLPYRRLYVTTCSTCGAALDT